MDVEVHVDQTASRRRRRGMLSGLLAFVLYLPAVILILSLMAAVLGREAAGRHAGAVFLAGFVTLMATTFWGTWGSLSYRCPRCSRRLSRVAPQGLSEPNMHYHCPDCRVIWDLGWARSSEGGIGG
jgi:DNA-directed RNA polymerase subunit RPC12/RpoP